MEIKKIKRPLIKSELEEIRDLLEQNYLEKEALKPNYTKIAVQTSFVLIILIIISKLVYGNLGLDGSALLGLTFFAVIIAFIILGSIFWKIVRNGDKKLFLNKQSAYYLKLLNPAIEISVVEYHAELVIELQDEYRRPYAYIFQLTNNQILFQSVNILSETQKQQFPNNRFQLANDPNFEKILRKKTIQLLGDKISPFATLRDVEYQIFHNYFKKSKLIQKSWTNFILELGIIE